MQVYPTEEPPAGHDDSPPHSCNCPDCFKRRNRGAYDVSNAHARLLTGLRMQEEWLAKQESKEKKPRTYSTRMELRDFFANAIADFESIFSALLMEDGQIPDSARPPKKRRRKSKQ